MNLNKKEINFINECIELYWEEYNPDHEDNIKNKMISNNLVKNLDLSGVMPSIYVVTYNDDYGRPIFDNCFNDKTIAEEYVKDHDYLRMDNTTVIKKMDFE